MSLPRVPVRTGYVPLIGGLDTETPAIAVEPGKVSDSINVYQHVNGGYRTIEGWEPFDGQVSPDEAIYSILEVTGLSGVSAGDTVTDGAETALVVKVLEDSLVLTMATGYFTPGNLLVGATVVGTFTDPQTDYGEDDLALAAEYYALAMAAYRALISDIPGTGATLGGKYFNGVLYAFRNHTDGLSAKLWKSTSAGWVNVPLGRELAFTSGGTVEPLAGQTITGSASGATAVLTRVVLESGDWSAGDAAGRFIFASQTGTFASENINIGASLNVATIAGNSSAITLQPSGSYKIIKANFTGSTTTERLYGCDGVNRGFEFDGTVFVPINTGMATDAPECVAEFVNHLMFSFDGSVQNSATGDPYSWIPYLGAAEIAVGDPVTNFVVQPGSESSPVLSITSKNSVHMMYGTSRDNWQLVPFKYEAGALKRSAQLIGQTFFLDTRGISTLGATDTYGNFAMSDMSSIIKTWLAAKVGLFTDSCVIRNKNLYCLFFSDGSGLFCTVTVNKNGSPVLGAMMPVLFPDPVVWAESSETSTGEEVVFFGCASGKIYKWGVGMSFAGESIHWGFTTHYVNFKSSYVSATMQKRFRLLTVEMSGDGYSEFSFSYSVGYGDQGYSQPTPVAARVAFDPSLFDDSYFDECFFDGTTLSPSRFDICGNAQNIAFNFFGSSYLSRPVIINGLNVLYSLTRETR